MDSPEPKPRLRLHISLLSLLLFTALIACGIVIAQQVGISRQLIKTISQQTQRVTQLEEKLDRSQGFFSVPDPKKLYFALGGVTRDLHEVRLFVPSDVRYRCCVQVHGFEKEDSIPVYVESNRLDRGANESIPIQQAIELPPGYGTFTLRYYRDASGKLFAEVMYSGLGISPRQPHSRTLSVGALSIAEAVAGDATEITDRLDPQLATEVPIGQAHVLFKQGAKPYDFVDAPSDHGITVWIEPIEGEPSQPRWWEVESHSLPLGDPDSAF